VLVTQPGAAQNADVKPGALADSGGWSDTARRPVVDRNNSVARHRRDGAQIFRLDRGAVMLYRVSECYFQEDRELYHDDQSIRRSPAWVGALAATAAERGHLLAARYHAGNRMAYGQCGGNALARRCHR